MRRASRTAAAVGVILALWLALALTQYHEYTHERDTARQALERQAETLRNALIGGIQSHRRLGHFLEEQLRMLLEEFARSDDVLAVSLRREGGSLHLTAGRKELLESTEAIPLGRHWQTAGLLLVESFELTPDASGPIDRRGGGRGPGWGRIGTVRGDDLGPLASGGLLQAAILLNRDATDQQCRRAAQLRLLVAIAGGAVLACLAVAWLTTVRWLEARSRAAMLQAEARHFRELSQAAAGLAHETRNPLGLIRGWTQRLCDGSLPEVEQRQKASAVLEECDRITSRINQFLAFVRPAKPEMEMVNVAAVIDELVWLMEPDLEAKQLRLDRSAVGTTTAIRADREMLRQALFNLLRNAVQFSPQGGTIEVELRSEPGGRWRLEVADRGPGVSPELEDRLFTPYFSTRADGTGLGLAIVRRIAAAHGWQAGYAARPGGGSTFWLNYSHDEHTATNPGR